MGLCVSGNVDPVEKKRNQEIDKQNQQDFLKENQVQKLLLLGAGESGKSTLFKQIVDLYGKGFTQEEYMEFVPIIFANTINAMQTLLKYGDQFNEEKGNTQVSPSLAAEKQFIQDLPSGQILTKEIADAIVKLWADPGVKNTYELRSRFQLAVAVDYFFSHAHEFAKDGWIPNKRDILQCRVRTTGIMETTLVYEGFQIKLVDVGGQRNERKKWIHSFENVQGLIFVAAISEYDQMLFEDDTVNRMTEALSIYAEIVNSKWFAESSMILFLNKSDLFREKIQKVPLTVCFPEYDGPANDYEAGWRFIAEEFLSKRENKNKDVYVQVTCATDDSNVTFVFNAVRDIVIQRALKKSGLMG